MSQKEKSFTNEEIQKIADANDFHVAPFREDGVTSGTPTWIWSVVVDNQIYVRAYNGTHSSWYQAAIKQKAGKVEVAGMTKEVQFEPVTGDINDKIDEAYREKYGDSPYLSPMISDRAKAATVRVF